MPESSQLDDTDTRTSDEGVDPRVAAMQQEVAAAVEDVNSQPEETPLDEDAINAAAIGTVEDDSGNSAENSDKEQPEQSEAQDDKQRTVIEPEAAQATEVTTKSADELRAARKITQLGTEKAELERTLDSFIKRDAEQIAADPTHFQRLLNNATTAEAQKYLDRVYQALPDVHKVAATEQFKEWQQIKLEGETEEQRIGRVARDLVEKELAPLRQREQARESEEQRRRDAEAVQIESEFKTRHGLTPEKFTDLEPKLMRVFAGLREVYPSMQSAELLDRSLLAIEPDAVRQTAKREALLTESDRNAAAMIQRSNPQTTPVRAPVSEEEQRLSAAFENIISNQQKRMPRRP